MAGLFKNNTPKRVRDTYTGEEYGSLAAAGRALAHLVQGDPTNNLVWYDIERKFPGRFEAFDRG